MRRVPFVVGNWKLYKSRAESVALARAVLEGAHGLSGVEVGVAPVATSISIVAEALAGSGVRIAGQNTYHEDQGAFTGELSPLLLADAGCTHCIVGHSERRTLFGETDAGVRKKAAALLRRDLVPIVCVGETLAERDAGQTLAVVLSQVDAALHGLDDLGPTVIAYEPVWAIGTGRNAEPRDAQEVHAAIRERVADTHGSPVAHMLRILYGGSVKPQNARALMSEADIDGALVGGASLSPDQFLPIVLAAAETA